MISQSLKLKLSPIHENCHNNTAANFLATVFIYISFDCLSPKHVFPKKKKKNSIRKLTASKPKGSQETIFLLGMSSLPNASKLFRITCPKPIKPTYFKIVSMSAHLNSQRPPERIQRQCCLKQT